eukprot:6180940-Pleurochrysis_carterae.AAC.2
MKVALSARFAHNSLAMTARSFIALVEVVHLQLLRHTRGRLGGHASRPMQHVIKSAKTSLRADQRA